MSYHSDWSHYVSDCTVHQNLYYQQANSDSKNCQSLWHQTCYDVTDKNNNTSSEDLDIHYH